jgi:hypothetical protein
MSFAHGDAQRFATQEHALDLDCRRGAESEQDVESSLEEGARRAGLTLGAEMQRE